MFEHIGCRLPGGPRRAAMVWGSPSGPGGAWVEAKQCADGAPPSPPSHLSTSGAADNRVGAISSFTGSLQSHNNDPYETGLVSRPCLQGQVTTEAGKLRRWELPPCTG